MTGPARSPRRSAARLLWTAVTVLVLASLLAPDVADRWADTQPEGWRRDVARAWATPTGRISRALALDDSLERVQGVFDGGKPTVTFAPAVRKPDAAMPSSILRTSEVDGQVEVPGLEVSQEPGATTTEPSGSDVPAGRVDGSGSDVPAGSVDGSGSDVPAGRVDGSGSDVPAGRVLPPDTIAPRRASAGDPLRILAVGDSLMLDLQWGMERVLDRRPDVIVEGRGALGFGFTVPHWDWDDGVLGDYALLVAEVRPDVVVVMIGANEFEGYVLDGKDLVPGSEHWASVLAERADEAMARWRADGAHVYWWTTPRMRDPRFLTDSLNAVWALTTAAWGSGATDLDSMDILGDETGAYRDQMVDEDGQTVALRKDYGVHFHEVGADLLARQLEERLVGDGWLVAGG
ncbi:MAG: hypothetical protein VYD42_03690 [Actinomycetota bacterium]|nr:hypothetical protein [Actinomycetota bacterium]